MKKLMTITLGILMIAFLSSFFGNSFSTKRKMAFKITDQLADKFKKKYGLHFAGVSETAPNGKYENIGLVLHFHRILSKDEGRVLLLECAQEMLHAFNSCPAFKQYMDNYPFTGNNITINIFIESRKHPYIYHPDIKIFSFYNNKLEYDTDTPETQKKHGNYYTEETETYEEAMKIVEAQKKDL